MARAGSGAAEGGTTGSGGDAGEVGSAVAATTRVEPSASEAAAALAAELAQLADPVLDEQDEEDHEERARGADVGSASEVTGRNEAIIEPQSAAAAALEAELAREVEPVDGERATTSTGSGHLEMAERIARMLDAAAARQRASDEARTASLVWSAALEVPRESRAGATKKQPGEKTKRLLLSLTSFWHLWCLRRKADIGEVSDWGPSWAQLHDFVEYVSNSRRSRSLMEEGRLGAGEDQLVLYVTMLFKHVLPTLYPRMVDPSRNGMGKGQYRALKEDASAAVHALFTESAMVDVAVAIGERVAIEFLEAHVEPRVVEAARRVGEASQTAAATDASLTAVRAAASAGRLAQLAALRTRVIDEVNVAADAAGQQAGEAAFEARRKQTSKPSTKIHAAKADVAMVRDVLATEALRRNRASVVDSFGSLVECAGTRPTSAVNTVVDSHTSVSYWANHAPMYVSDFTVSHVGLNDGQGVTVEGHQSKLQVRAATCAMDLQSGRSYA